MFSFGRKAAPAPAANGKRTNGSNRNTMNEAQKKLATALNNIASHHINKYANAIRVSAKAEANAARAAAVAAAEPTHTNVTKAITAANNASAAQRNVKEAERAAADVVNAVPVTETVPVAAQNAEAAAVNAVARNAAALANFNQRIIAANNRAKLTQIEVNLQNYASKHNIPYNRNNIKKRLNAVNNKRNSLLNSHPIKTNVIVTPKPTA
jgi:hypothetical protein